ncbi:MAG: very-short-patch-repair endonuclease [Porticoccaceae bacterium]
MTPSGGDAGTRSRVSLKTRCSLSGSTNSCSESPHEILERQPAYSGLLKAYLEYAERGVDSLAKMSEVTGLESEPPFEAEVADALIRRGLQPVPQVGCGGFRIDLALQHPERPGEFCLGIECDGATYHSSRTARDRDRLRQSVLEGLGWNLVRVWSADWVRSPERQIDRILAGYELASSSVSTGSFHRATESWSKALPISGSSR